MNSERLGLRRCVGAPDACGGVGREGGCDGGVGDDIAGGEGVEAGRAALLLLRAT